MGTSIVVLTYNNLNYTKECIESIREYTADEDYEIIVVDNNSTDDTQDWLKTQSDLKVQFNKENRGFPGGCNDGIKISNPENDILLLNNDIVVTSNWLSNLRTALYSSEDIGAVTAVTNRSSYGQNIFTNYENMDEMQSFAEQYNVSNPSLWEERLKLVAYSFLVKREVINKVGLLDELFCPGNYEDDDYCLRIVLAGYKLLLCSDTFIHHYGSASFNENLSSFDDTLLVNSIKFYNKWKISLDDIIIKNYYLDFVEDKENLKFLELYGDCGASGLLLKHNRKNSEFFIMKNSNSSYEISSKIHESYDSSTNMNFDYIIINQGELFLKNKILQLKLKKTFSNSNHVIITLNNKTASSPIRTKLIKQLYKVLKKYGFDFNESAEFFYNDYNDRLILMYSKKDLIPTPSENVISFICNVNDISLLEKCKNRIFCLNIPQNFDIEIIDNLANIDSNVKKVKARGKYKVYLKSEEVINNEDFLDNLKVVLMKNNS